MHKKLLRGSALCLSHRQLIVVLLEFITEDLRLALEDAHFVLEIGNASFEARATDALVRTILSRPRTDALPFVGSRDLRVLQFQRRSGFHFTVHSFPTQMLEISKK